MIKLCGKVVRVWAVRTQHNHHRVGRFWFEGAGRRTIPGACKTEFGPGCIVPADGSVRGSRFSHARDALGMNIIIISIYVPTYVGCWMLIASIYHWFQSIRQTLETCWNACYWNHCLMSAIHRLKMINQYCARFCTYPLEPMPIQTHKHVDALFVQ